MKRYRILKVDYPDFSCYRVQWKWLFFGWRYIRDESDDPMERRTEADAEQSIREMKPPKETVIREVR